MTQNYNALNFPIYKTIEFLHEFFSNSEKFKYMDSEDLTKIFIREKNSININAIDTRPVIAVSRGSTRFGNVVMGNFWKMDKQTGEETFVDSAQTNMNISCLAKNGAVAEEIASAVFGAFKFNRQYILSKGFIRMTPPAVSEEQIIRADSDIEIINVSVVFDVGYLIRWTRKPKNVYTVGEVVFQVEQ